MIIKVPTTTDARSLKNDHRSEEGNQDLFTENQFMRSVLEHDDQNIEDSTNTSPTNIPPTPTTRRNRMEYDEENADKQIGDNRTLRRLVRRRTLNVKRPNTNERERMNENEEDKAQIMKLITSGSKTVHFGDDDYDDENAEVADAIDLELQREQQKERMMPSQSRGDKRPPTTTTTSIQSQQQQHQPKQHPKNHSDEVKIVAVSVSTSSRRQQLHDPHKQQQNKQQQQQQQQHNHQSQSRRAQTERKEYPQARPSTQSIEVTNVSALATTTTTPRTLASAKGEKSTDTSIPHNFINRSHRSELVIEESDPLTMSQIPHGRTFAAARQFHSDSAESASTNIHKVLSDAASAHDSVKKTANNPAAVTTRSTVTTSTHQTTSNYNSTRINHSSSGSPVTYAGSSDSNQKGDVSLAVATKEDKLLPFQTVIYHDTKEGHGPQSRSISYSSISQNVDDLKAWQKSGILAEAQRNVSESLKSGIQTHLHTSEPSKFYSVPAKMYGVPSKFYSEPAKVYSEPAKVYGEPEKFYSEPAKVYGKPAKFYSEPAKVYSQPAKVYSEPAKTYWPRLPPSGSTGLAEKLTTKTTTTVSPPITPSIGAFPLRTASAATLIPPPTRRPAIVSRIAFGEAQTTHAPAEPGHYATQSHHNQPNQQQHSENNASTQPRRVLSNLDKLPYDLLNAPGQSQTNLFESVWNSKPASSKDAAMLDFVAAKQSLCSENAPTMLQQHRSSTSNRHSDQNAKGLSNEGIDLVKCTATNDDNLDSARRFSPTVITERSHVEDLYTPTPEQNYEIEESVSVMTNGRAHGVRGRGSIGLTATTTTTTKPPSPQQTSGGFTTNGFHRGETLYETGVNVKDDDSVVDEHYYDEVEEEEEVEKEEESDDSNNGSNGKSNSKSSGVIDDDSKVAYVVEGRNYRKYRVEEKTDDGFIVGEYGVVDHSDGNLRGVRYTADSTINRSLIQKALLTFLKLK